MRRAGSCRIRASGHARCPRRRPAQRQNARCLTARAGTAGRVRCALRSALRGRRAMIAYATHAASARSGSRLARRELRAASRLIAHSDRRATAPTSTIRPPCSARSSSWRSASHALAPGGPARRAHPRRTPARPPARSAAEPPLAPRPPPAGDAPGTPRCRAHAATCAQLSPATGAVSIITRCPADALAVCEPAGGCAGSACCSPAGRSSIVRVAGATLAGRAMFAVAVSRSWRSSASVTIRSSSASTCSCAARWIADAALAARSSATACARERRDAPACARSWPAGARAPALAALSRPSASNP